MKLRALYFIAIVTLIFSCNQNPSQTEIAEAIEGMLVSVDDEGLAKVYQENNNKPLWIKSGGLNRSGQRFLEELDEIVYDGLNKSDYLSDADYQSIEALKESENTGDFAKIDIILSEAFVKLAKDLDIGKINPQALDIEWKMERKTADVDLYEKLSSISRANNVTNILDDLRPDNEEYDKLRSQLQELLKNNEEENSQPVFFTGKIEKGDSHQAIPTIRKKLAFWNEIKSESTDQTYNEELFEAVISFQKRHGLIDDGILGADFIEAINYSKQDLISKVKVNLERWRWMPNFTDSDKNKVIVNIPDFYLYYLEKQDTLLTSKVVVGREFRQTPVFKSEMTYMVFSPTWTLPETILWEDAIPAIAKNPNYLESHHMKVINKSGEEENPKKIKWEKLQDKTDFPYLIRQSPGKENPLGRVKFMFPNEYSIYIHDSPAQGLFEKDERTFSSGCIRMEKPVEFASLLLNDMDDWNAEKINKSMELEEEENISLSKAQEVWILYVSVWQKGDRLAVREDIYDMDKKLAKAMGLEVSKYFL